MKDIILQYLDSFWILLTSIAPYILVGIFLAAVMKQLIDNEWVKRRLGGDNISSLIRSILLGIPLPLCSCSVIPFATTLYKSGASKASTLGFLISTPITGIDSIIATYGVFGWFFTLYRVVVSTIVAFVAGILSTLFWIWVAMCKASSLGGFYLATGEPTHLDEIPHFVFWVTGGLAIAVFIIFLVMTFFKSEPE